VAASIRRSSAQRAKEVFFLGMFRAGADVGIEDGLLRVVQEGAGRKFVSSVEQVTFSGEYARERGQRVHVVTERCVLRLAEQGLEVVAVAPGLDLEKDVLSGMEFVPEVSPKLAVMDSALFVEPLLGLRHRPLLRLDERLSLDIDENILYCNFEGLRLDTRKQVDALAECLEVAFLSAGRRVQVVVNYDNFELAPALVEPFFAMVRKNADLYSVSTTRYSTNAFFRRQLGRQFAEAKLNHALYENFTSARAGLYGERLA